MALSNSCLLVFDSSEMQIFKLVSVTDKSSFIIRFFSLDKFKAFFFFFVKSVFIIANSNASNSA